MTLSKHEQQVLEAVREKPGVSPRDLERTRPADATPREVRVALQRLVSTGAVAFDNSLKLVIPDK